MALKIVTVSALCVAMMAPAKAATAVDMQLIRAAFFSDACRQEAEALGIARTSDASALVAAFAGLRRHGARASGGDAQRNDCSVPAVALINLLRLNGIDAELVSAAMTKDATPADQSDRVLVYVPTLDRAQPHTVAGLGASEDALLRAHHHVRLRKSAFGSSGVEDMLRRFSAHQGHGR